MRHDTVRRYIETDDVIVAVDVPVVYSPEEPDEPLLEPDAIRFLDEVTRRARSGDRQWLKAHGRIFDVAHA